MYKQKATGIDSEIYKKMKDEFGSYSSWAVWENPEERKMSNTKYLKKFEDEAYIRENLRTDYVFVGLNIADHNIDEFDDWRNFHSNRKVHQRDYVLAYLLDRVCGGKFWGSYMTDIYKGIAETKSAKLQKDIDGGLYDEQILKSRELFKRELEYLEKNNKGYKPVLICFGTSAYEETFYQFGDEYKVVYIKHFSASGSIESLEESWTKILKHI